MRTGVTARPQLRILGATPLLKRTKTLIPPGFAATLNWTGDHDALALVRALRACLCMGIGVAADCARSELAGNEFLAFRPAL
jgi:hypothetical protein